MIRLPLISGVGLVTPLGATLDETWRALHAGASIRRHSRAAGMSDTPGRFFDMAERAAREAMSGAGWEVEPAAALVFGTSKGPIECWLPPAGSTSDNPNAPAGGVTIEHPAGSFGLSEAASNLAARLHLRGPRLTLSAACASGLHALIRAAMMVRSGEAQRVLVVAAEASVHPLFLGSFARLGVLPPEGVGCRPFDTDRAGFLMSEAAAAVCLEAPPPGDSPAGEGRRVCVERFALGGDATHLTGTDADGRTYRHLLAHVLDGRPADLIHAHGTGTVANDPVELAAIEACVAGVGGPPPAVYSHKGALGHSLGAAGLVSVVLNWTAHREGIIPPNVGTVRPLPTRGVRINPCAEQRIVRRSIAAAAGFGGPTAVVSLVGGRDEERVLSAEC